MALTKLFRAPPAHLDAHLGFGVWGDFEKNFLMRNFGYTNVPWTGILAHIGETGVRSLTAPLLTPYSSTIVVGLCEVLSSPDFEILDLFSAMGTLHITPSRRSFCWTARGCLQLFKFVTTLN